MENGGSSEFRRVSTQEPKEDDDTGEGEKYEDYVCGLGSFKPQWIQRLANTKAFLVLFCILGILEGAAFTYMVGVLSSWEKRYAFDSKMSGVIFIADNLSSIVISILVGYYGSHAHRPRWIACGMMIVAFSCLFCSLPYWIYGPGLHLLTREADMNSTAFQLCKTDSPKDICEASTSMTNVAISIFFFANFLNGFGYTAFYTVGTAYIDDSVKKKNSPIYFSTQMSVRLLGPSFGYVLASFSLRFYENPLYDPGLSMKDPRWVGAWWMGFVILGVLLFIFSLPMFLFPRKLRDQANNSPKEDKLTKGAPKFKDIPSTFYRLMSNPIWMFHTIAVVFHVNGYMGYFILMPRYMEAHFRQTASGASFFSGTTSIVTMIVGIMLGGIVISKLRPRPRILTGYMSAVALAGAVAMLVSMFIACPTLSMVGETNQQGTLDLGNECNKDCGCTTKVFHPVCSSDGVSTYFSPCYAGCTGKSFNDNNETVLTNCNCDATVPNSMVELTSGYCPFGCTYFLTYIIIMSVSKMIGATARVGSVLISLRCVDAKDKNLSLGGISAMLSACAFIPYPLVFGALADSTCLVWENKCGSRGNCWVYDVDKLRYRMHGASMALILIAAVFDAIVCYYSDRMTGDFYGDPTEDQHSQHSSQVPLKQIQEYSQSSEESNQKTRSRTVTSSQENISGL